MKKILVPSDGSENALRAVEHAATVARESAVPVEVHLLHVIDPVTFTSLTANLSGEPLKRERPAAVDRVLAPAQTLLHDAGVPFQVCWRVGDAGDQIAAEVKENRYDSVVMGTRGMGTLASVVFGSVASKVRYMVDIPITLVK